MVETPAGKMHLSGYFEGKALKQSGACGLIVTSLSARPPASVRPEIHEIKETETGAEACFTGTFERLPPMELAASLRPSQGREGGLAA